MPHRSPNAARIAGSVEGVGMSSLSARAPTGQKTAVQSVSVIQVSPAGNMDSLYAPRLQCHETTSRGASAPKRCRNRKAARSQTPERLRGITT